MKDYQEILNRWSIQIDFELILSMWNSPNRFYHNETHLRDILEKIRRDAHKYTIFQYDELVLTALFHDIIYDPNRDDNEEKSANFFLDFATNKKSKMIGLVYQNILDTKDHVSNSYISEAFIKYDMDILNMPFEELIEWEKSIRKEYSNYSDKEYKKGRLSFLYSVLDKYENKNEDLLKLIDYILNKNIYETI